MGNEVENWQTRLNYSERVKSTLSLLTFGLLAIAVDTTLRPEIGGVRPQLPDGPLNIIQHTAFDAFTVPVYTSMAKFIGNEKNRIIPFLTASIYSIGYESWQYIAQNILKISKSGFSEYDLAAYGIGAIGWVLFDYSAKLLHDSGLTHPIYKVFGIKHRKFDNIQA